MRSVPWPVTRRSVAALVPLLLLVPRPASGAEAESFREERETVALTTSAVTPIFGAYLLEGEIRASSSFAVLLGASYLAIEQDDWKVRAGTLNAGLTYYFGNDALRGWYVEGAGEAWLASWRHQPSREVAPVVVGYAAVAIFGYQFVCDLGPVLDLGVGATAFHVPRAHVRVAGAPLSSGAVTQVYPALKVSLGWAF
jgi:hypothetical protein